LKAVDGGKNVLQKKQDENDFMELAIIENM